MIEEVSRTRVHRRRVIKALCSLAAGSALPLFGRAAAQSAAERIIVSGASGQLGGLVVTELLARAVPAERLILVSRTPDELQRYAARGASVRYGDFTEPGSLGAAYAGGARMLLISIGNTGLPRPEAHANAIRAAAQVGVQHIAYTSWIGISHGETGGLAPDHAATEEILRDSGAAWTMLRNSIYMNGVVADAARMLAAGRVTVPGNADRIAYVTREDCAAAAAAVLIAAGHENQAYDITGPEAVGPAEIAAAASAVAGRPIEIVDAPAAPPSPFASPGGGVVSADFEQVVGRPPTSVQQLLEANREQLLGMAAPLG